MASESGIGKRSTPYPYLVLQNFETIIQYLTKYLGQTHETK